MKNCRAIAAGQALAVRRPPNVTKTIMSTNLKIYGKEMIRKAKIYFVCKSVKDRVSE